VPRDAIARERGKNGQMHHLGVSQSVEQTTLTRTNENPDWRICADYGEYPIDDSSQSKFQRTTV